MAFDKYYKTNIVRTYPDAVQLFTDEIWPKIQNNDSNTWRWDVYLCEEVDIIYKRYLAIFKEIYTGYSGRTKTPGAKVFMSIQEFNECMVNLGLINELFAERDITILFGISMMTQVDELN